MKIHTKHLSMFLSLLVALVLCVTPLSSMELTTSETTTIILPASDLSIDLWQEQTDFGDYTSYYTIYKNNEPVRTTETSYVLGLRYDQFDPLDTVPTVPSVLQADADIQLYIVQFYTQPLVEYREAISAYGGEIYQYIAQNAFLVKMTEPTMQQVASLPYVRWVGYYQPAYRLEEFMLDHLETAEESYPNLRYNIQVHSEVLKAVIVDKISALGGQVDKADAGKHLVVATLTPDQLFQVCRFDEVNFIDRWGPYETDMNNAREIGGANYIETVAGFTGEGVRGEVFDNGFNLAHVDFQSRPLITHGTCGSQSHGASTSGICFGDGTGNPDARGMLPDGQGIVADYNYWGLEGPNRYQGIGELVQDPYFAVFQTASVGSPRTTQYTTVSADTDQAIFDFDIILCQSQSNAGNQMSRPQAWAKNIISGGGIKHQDTLSRHDDQWNYGASIGPASDGRIKPTFTHFYDYILTTTSGGSNAYTTSFGGTSGATPIIAGHVGLVFDMWSEGIFGNPVDPEASVFENKCHFTTAKALLINTAYQYPFNGTNHDKTRVHQGWGMPDLQTLYDYRENMLIIDETEILEPLDVHSYNVFVQPDEPRMKITMTYADLPGNPSIQTQHRINDITLKVISPSGVEYYGNNGLLQGVWSEVGGAPDIKNTVENVFIQNPEVGRWTVEISADELIEDSHIETTELDADYALVVSGVETFLVPDPPYGPTRGDCGCSYEFHYDVPEDILFDEIWALWSWDDGSYSDWMGPYGAGETISYGHGWNLSGPKDVQIKLTDFDEYESIWSEPWVFTIYPPLLDISPISGGLGNIKAVIRNTGEGNASAVSYKINLNGGLILLGQESTGYIEFIGSGEDVWINSDFILGLGETTITITAEPQLPEGDDVREQSAKMFLIYTYIIPGGG